jgi:hypothetical protein
MAERDFINGSGCVDLRALPEFAPDAGLWTRIEAAERSRQRRARWTRTGLAIAAVAIAAVALVRMHGSTPLPASDVLAGQQESQALESQWQQLAAGVRSVPTGSTQLRAIDATLQSAYDRRAGQDEIVPLWQERNRALRNLIDVYRNSGLGETLAVTRI